MIVDAHIHVWNSVDGKIANKVPVIALSGGMIRIGEREMLGMPPYMLDAPPERNSSCRNSMLRA